MELFSKMSKHKKLKKLHNVQKRRISITQKALILLIEFALVCDFSIYPLPVKASNLDLIDTKINQFSIKDKILKMETSPKEINKALYQLKQKELKLEKQIAQNKARLKAETEQFKRDQANLEEKERQEREQKKQKQAARIVQNQNDQKSRIIKLPRGVTIYAKPIPKDNKNYRVLWSDYRTFTGYNSDPWQTDDTPCIAANGFDVCKHGIEDTVAANFLKFGTKIRIPQVYGDRVFTVRDRMNRRYPNSVDIWMIYKKDAKEFGRRVLKIEVVEELK